MAGQRRPVRWMRGRSVKFGVVDVTLGKDYLFHWYVGVGGGWCVHLGVA